MQMTLIVMNSLSHCYRHKAISTGTASAKRQAFNVSVNLNQGLNYENKGKQMHLWEIQWIDIKCIFVTHWHNDSDYPLTCSIWLISKWKYGFAFDMTLKYCSLLRFTFGDEKNIHISHMVLMMALQCHILCSQVTYLMFIMSTLDFID